MSQLHTSILFTTSDPELSAHLCNILRNQLKEYEGITFLKNEEEEIPDGAFGVDPVTIGALAIVVLPTLLPAIINAIKDLKLSNTNSNIKVNIKDRDKEINAEFPKGTTTQEIDGIVQTLVQQVKSL